MELAYTEIEGDGMRIEVTGGQGGPAVNPDAIRINGRIVRAGESLSQVRGVPQADGAVASLPQRPLPRRPRARRRWTSTRASSPT
jgi:hypothetical protein